MTILTFIKIFLLYISCLRERKNFSSFAHAFVWVWNEIVDNNKNVNEAYQRENSHENQMWIWKNWKFNQFFYISKSEKNKIMIILISDNSLNDNHSTASLAIKICEILHHLHENERERILSYLDS